MGFFRTHGKNYLSYPSQKLQDQKLPQETRPINLLPSYEKIIEIIVHKQLSTYLEENNLLYNQQFGFRKARSTETALQVIFSSWGNTLNQNKFVITVSLDLKRAFETISREILLKKLEYYGIKVHVLQ
jgi:hypothetical protein